MAALQKELVVHRDPDILGGTLVFVGTRVPARILFEHLEAGDSLEVFLEQFPSVSREQAVAASRSTFREVLPFASPLQRAEQADLSIRPELPPDAGLEPPQMSPPAVATRGDLRPVAKPHVEPPSKGVAVSATSAATPSAGEPGIVERSSAADIESAIETMLNEDANARPVGAHDWKSSRIAIGAFYFLRGFSPIWTDNGRFTITVAGVEAAEDAEIPWTPTERLLSAPLAGIH